MKLTEIVRSMGALRSAGHTKYEARFDEDGFCATLFTPWGIYGLVVSEESNAYRVSRFRCPGLVSSAVEDVAADLESDVLDAREARELVRVVQQDYERILLQAKSATS